MATEVKVPALGESITSGILVTWLVKDGEYVNKGDLLYELETDKITSEAPAEISGAISHKVAEGEEVAIDQVVALIDEKAQAPKTEEKPAPEAVPEVEPKADESETDKEEAASKPATTTLSPAVRKLVEEHNLDSSAIQGTGKDGRLLKADVLAVIEEKKTSPKTPVAKEQEADSNPVADTARRTTRQKLSPIRRRIAERLVAAQQQAALLTTFNEVDLREVIALRKKHQEAFVARHGLKLGFMSFFVKAVVQGLQAVPGINAQLEGDTLVQNHFYDIGVAVGTEKGLVVPVLRDCDQSSFAEIEQQIAGYAKKARESKITIEDIQGGVFTISNGGIYGSMLSTPIVNPPQSGILGMHAIQERPVARNGEVVIRPMMYLALSYDHRIIDGKEAVTFLKTVKELLEEPARMLFGA